MKRFIQLAAILTFAATLHAADITALLIGELQKRGAKFENLQVDAVKATYGDGLEVTSIQYDPVHAKTYFRIRDSHKHSFEVGVSGSILFPTLIASRELATGTEGGHPEATPDS